MKEVEYIPRSPSSNSKQENRFKWIFASLLVVIIVLVITIGILSVYVFNSYSKSFCTSTECIQSAATIKTTMDLNYDPCDDFFKFACNNFEQVNLGHAHPMKEFTTFRKIKYRLDHVMLKLIDEPLKKKDPQPIRMIKNFYKACTDKGKREELGLSVMDKYFDQVNLPKIPTIFTLPEENWSNYSFNWVKTSVLMKKTFGIDLFVNVKFEKDSVEFSVTPEKPIVKPLLSEEVLTLFDKLNLPSLIDKFKPAMVHLVSEMLASERKFKGFRSVLDMVSTKIWNMTQEYRNVVKKYGVSTVNAELETISLKDFQNLTDENLIKNGLLKNSDEDWENYVTMLYKELSGESKNFSEVNVTYWGNGIDYISNLPVTLSKIPDVMLEMYAWWRAIDLMILYTSEEMSLTLNHLLYAYTPKDSNCLELAINNFNPIIAFGVITEDFFKNTQPQVIDFVEDLLEVFEESIQNFNWIDEETEEIFLNKLEEIQIFVGAPDWITNETRIMSEYSRLNIKRNTHLDNIMQIVQNSVLNTFKSGFLDDEEISNEDELSYYGNMNEVNALYFYLTNSITIPWSILNPPVYNLGLPSLQYGALGTIISHEIIHAFDRTGILSYVDELNETWLKKFSDAFDEKSKCFMEQYENFSIKTYGKEHKINATATFDENIADNGGVQIAFYALKKYLASPFRRESKLPGFEDYTSEQLFFLALAQSWCSAEQQEVEKLISTLHTHAPNHVRINGIVQNTPEFAEAFNCPLGSNMNPNRKRCDMWLIKN